MGDNEASERPDDEEEDEDEEQPVAKQEAPIMQVQQAHPEVILPQEVKSAGVALGQDAEKMALPEEKQTIEVTLPEESQPVAPALDAASPLPMPYEEAKRIKKTANIKDSIKWWAAKIMYHWEKLGIKTQPKEVVPEQVTGENL